MIRRKPVVVAFLIATGAVITMWLFFGRPLYLDRLESVAEWRVAAIERAANGFIEREGRSPTDAELYDITPRTSGVTYCPLEDGFLLVGEYKGNTLVRMRRGNLLFRITKFPRLYEDPRLSIYQLYSDGRSEPIYPQLQSSPIPPK